MAAIKDSAAIAAKWARVTPGRSEDYAEGVRTTPKDWAGQTEKAEGAYKSGIAEAIAKGLFAKGVRAAGTEKWRKQTLEKGAARWVPGVTAAAGAYQEGFEPFRATIAALTLPPRFAKGDPRNIERVRVIATALRKKKVGG